MAVREALDLARFFFDIGWASGEYASKLATEPFLRRIAKRTTSPRAVLTLPGFGGPEISLSPLNAFLNRQGFLAEGWGLGTNRGPRDADSVPQLIEALTPKLERLKAATGGKVALVGQSLGGIYAREVARARPALVDRVITLGSPAYLRPDALEHMNRTLDVAMRWMTGKRPKEHFDDNPAEQLYAPPPVPLVAIYSAFDGIVDATTTAIPVGDLTFEGGLPRENIEIVGSHCGMAVNPIVLVAVCDRLLADPKAWSAFDGTPYFPGGSRFLSGLLYPRRRRASAA